MERITFTSLADPDRGYSWQRSGYDHSWRYNGRVDSFKDNAAQYQTYGDGTVQHSPDAPVPRHLALDYLASLAAYLQQLEVVDLLIALEAVDYEWPKPGCHVGRQEVVFALGLKCKDNGKVQYYNKSHRKVSGADSKRHDKRWSEVVPWMDGTVKGAVGICNMCHFNPLDTYSLAVFVADIQYELRGHTSSNREVAEICGLVGEDNDRTTRDYTNNLSSAYHAVDAYVKGYRLMEDGKRSWSCLQNNYCRNVLGHEVEA